MNFKKKIIEKTFFFVEKNDFENFRKKYFLGGQKKYSEKLGALVQTKNGEKVAVEMGSYGIGISRLVGAIIEAKYNDKDEIMKWPLAVSPYDIAIIPLVSKNETSNVEKANSIYNFLKEKKAMCETIPYKFNRAVLFDSAYFHETDKIDFKDGYESRRINITYLFGNRLIKKMN